MSEHRPEPSPLTVELHDAGLDDDLRNLAVAFSLSMRWAILRRPCGCGIYNTTHLDRPVPQ